MGTSIFKSLLWQINQATISSLRFASLLPIRPPFFHYRVFRFELLAFAFPLVWRHTIWTPSEIQKLRNLTSKVQFVQKTKYMFTVPVFWYMLIEDCFCFPVWQSGVFGFELCPGTLLLFIISIDKEILLLLSLIFIRYLYVTCCLLSTEKCLLCRSLELSYFFAIFLLITLSSSL